MRARGLPSHSPAHCGPGRRCRQGAGSRPARRSRHRGARRSRRRAGAALRPGSGCGEILIHPGAGVIPVDADARQIDNRCEPPRRRDGRRDGEHRIARFARRDRVQTACRRRRARQERGPLAVRRIRTVELSADAPASPRFRVSRGADHAIELAAELGHKMRGAIAKAEAEEHRHRASCCSGGRHGPFPRGTAGSASRSRRGASAASGAVPAAPAPTRRRRAPAARHRRSVARPRQRAPHRPSCRSRSARCARSDRARCV